MSPSELFDIETALVTHTRRFSLLFQRLNTWSQGWAFSVSVLVAAIPGAGDALRSDMLAVANITEEMGETLADLTGNYLKLAAELQHQIDEGKRIGDG